MAHGPKTYSHIIGVDPGVTVGLARWDGKKLTDVFQTDIFEAYDWIIDWKKASPDLLVLVEDARKNKRGADATSDPRKEGAGWVKYLSGEFERLMVKHKIDYVLKTPAPKITPQLFLHMTGIKTLEKESHIRDAAMMVLNHPLSYFYHPSPVPKKR